MQHRAITIEGQKEVEEASLRELAPGLLKPMMTSLEQGKIIWSSNHVSGVIAKRIQEMNDAKWSAFKQMQKIKKDYGKEKPVNKKGTQHLNEILRQPGVQDCLKLIMQDFSFYQRLDFMLACKLFFNLISEMHIEEKFIFYKDKLIFSLDRFDKKNVSLNDVRKELNKLFKQSERNKFAIDYAIANTNVRKETNMKICRDSLTLRQISLAGLVIGLLAGLGIICGLLSTFHRMDSNTTEIFGQYNVTNSTSEAIGLLLLPLPLLTMPLFIIAMISIFWGVKICTAYSDKRDEMLKFLKEFEPKKVDAKPRAIELQNKADIGNIQEADKNEKTSLVKNYHKNTSILFGENKGTTVEQQGNSMRLSYSG